MSQIATTVASTLTRKSNVLSDVSAFYGLSGNPIMAYDSDVAGGEIYNVMSTLEGDECFEPTYGCDLPLRLFEPMTPSVLSKCQNDVFQAGRDWVVHAAVSERQTVAYADASNRVVGVEVAYQFAGAGWTVSVALSQAFSGVSP